MLSPAVPDSPEAVEVGRHGLVISDGARRGLLLPQVPVENGWDRETFLEQTCRKAGLPRDAWRKSRNSTIEAFTAEVFGDEDVRVRPLVFRDPLWLKASAWTKPGTALLPPNFRGSHVRTLVFCAEQSKLGAGRRFAGRLCEGSMELAVVIVVLIVAGAMIPGDSKIPFFR